MKANATASLQAASTITLYADAGSATDVSAASIDLVRTEDAVVTGAPAFGSEIVCPRLVLTNDPCP